MEKQIKPSPAQNQKDPKKNKPQGIVTVSKTDTGLLGVDVVENAFVSNLTLGS